MEKFRELGLKEELLEAIEELGFIFPTPVQEKVIPVILGEENDLVALAQTGTGKTAAFGLPLLQKLDLSQNVIQVLILSPTRELCVQIGKDLQNYAKYSEEVKITCVYGGAEIRRQIKELEKGVQVLVATPGRLCDLIKRGAVNIEHVHAVVLDEADEMLNMGFKEDLNFILDETPESRNTYLFSATMPREVERIAKNYLRNAKEISTGKKNQGADTVSHDYYMVKAKDCYETLRRIIDCAPDMYAIIFVRTKIDARDISKKLQKDGIECDALHGDLSQSQRDDVMERFRAKRLKVLVATDVAARGLDVDNLTHVINYNLPEDVESYTHRSGRTGRAGKEGTSVAIIHSKEKGKLRRIEKMISKKFQYREVPGGEEVCRAQLLFYADKIMGAEHKEIMNRYQRDLYEKFELLSKEELIQKIISYEFGKLLKKYANVEDLNLPAHERGEKRHQEVRLEDEEYEYTTFSVNVGREDGFTPRDLMAIINMNAPRKGLQIGSIRIFETNTKFEVDIRGIKGFKACFKNVNFNGLPFTLTEIKDRYNRGKDEERDRKRNGDRKRKARQGKSSREEYEREYAGKRKKSTVGNKWRTEKSRKADSPRERFEEKKKGNKGKEKRSRR